MLYKPRFCCHCGQKITRIEWNLFTSRRFCEVCAIENQGTSYLHLGVIGVGLLGIVFGIGSFFGSSASKNSSDVSTTPVMLKNASPAAKDLPQIVDSRVREAQPPLVVVPQTSDYTERQIGSRESPKAVPVYYCGAMTKKGTACSRRVKSFGHRCFQHEGKPSAMSEN